MSGHFSVMVVKLLPEAIILLLTGDQIHCHSDKPVGRQSVVIVAAHQLGDLDKRGAQALDLRHGEQFNDTE